MTKTEVQSLQGTWVAKTYLSNGKEQTGKNEFGSTITTWLVIKDDSLSLNGVGTRPGTAIGWNLKFTYTIDPGRTPKAMTLTVAEGEGKGAILRAIYRLQRDTLKVCYSSKARPKSFSSRPGSNQDLLILHRTKS